MKNITTIRLLSIVYLNHEKNAQSTEGKNLSYHTAENPH